MNSQHNALLCMYNTHIPLSSSMFHDMTPQGTKPNCYKMVQAPVFISSKSWVDFARNVCIKQCYVWVVFVTFGWNGIDILYMYTYWTCKVWGFLHHWSKLLKLYLNIPIHHLLLRVRSRALQTLNVNRFFYRNEDLAACQPGKEHESRNDS